MVDIKYSNAYSEVLEILKYISIEDYNKIPKNKIELFETNANNNYNFTYNPNKTLDEQGVSKITKGIIAILFRDYWANDIQRKKVITFQNYYRSKIEEEKKNKYDTNIFPNNNKKIQNIEENVSSYEFSMIEYKYSFFRKILNKLKLLFKK